MTKLVPQPWKHPKLGTYYYRKVVPADLRESLGGLLNKPSGRLTELRLPLKTTNANQAKLKYPDASAEADALLARAAGGPVRLIHQQVIALAGVWYVRELSACENEPSAPTELDCMLDYLKDTADEGEGLRTGAVGKAVADDVNGVLAHEQLQVGAGTRTALWPTAGSVDTRLS